MAIKFIKSNYSFAYSSKGMFIIDNNTLRKYKLSNSNINKKTIIKGKILGRSFTINSVPDKDFFMYNGSVGRRNYTAFIYLDNKKIGDLEKDQVIILNPDNFDWIPITLWMDNDTDYYRVSYFFPHVKKIKVFHKNKLMGYATMSKDKYNLYIKSGEDFPLFFTLFLAAFNSSITPNQLDVFFSINSYLAHQLR